MQRYPGSDGRDQASGAKHQADVIDLEAHRQRRRQAERDKAAADQEGRDPDRAEENGLSREENHQE